MNQEINLSFVYSKPTIVMSPDFKSIMSPTGFEKTLNGMESVDELTKESIRDR
jgi:hypothetical protein